MSTELEAQLAIENVRAQVEHALQTRFGVKPVLNTSDFQGKLSTQRLKVDPKITSEVLFGRCGTFTEELRIVLKPENLDIYTCYSDRRDGSGHAYLCVNSGGMEILIDPSIGQFIEGHPHVFVGTREKLRDLVVNQTGEGKPYHIVHTSSANNPQEAFERIWGNTSRKIKAKELKRL